MKSYTVKKSAVPVVLDAAWDSEMWANANIAKVDFAFAQNSDHTPDVQLKMLHDGERICGLYQVKDQYVIARAIKDQDMVCRDSCVEFFVKPAGSKYYYNFEFNCGGTLLLYRCANLKSGEYTVKEVSSVLGFENIAYFSNTFKDYYGLSPVNFTKSQDRKNL